MNFPDFFQDISQDTTHKIFVSILLLVISLALRIVFTQAVLRQVSDPVLRRRWIVNIRNSVVLLVAFALAAIWLDVLRTVGAWLAFATVALVIATKEFIMCIGGSILRTATNAYSVGDRVEIGEYRGDVIDLNLLTTTILEVGPSPTFHQRTGRAIVLPNSMFMEKGVINESYMRQFVVHVFSVPLKIESDWRRAEEVLLEAANIECASFLDEAKRYMDEIEKYHSLESLPTQPRVAIEMPDPSRVNLVVRFPSPVGRRGRLEQAILRRFITNFYGSRPMPPETHQGAAKS
jgi:small-conductance mechanosensitive channel